MCKALPAAIFGQAVERFSGSLVEAHLHPLFQTDYKMPPAIVALLVEDEPLIRMTVEDVLLGEKVDFISVGSGDAAIIKLQENAARFHLIISDIRMPGSVDGWGVGRAARELSPDVAVIYITGDSAAHWAANGVQNSILLQKPFTDSQLIEAIRSFAR